jgi:hypothetical protein
MENVFVADQVNYYIFTQNRDEKSLLSHFQMALFSH